METFTEYENSSSFSFYFHEENSLEVDGRIVMYVEANVMQSKSTQKASTIIIIWLCVCGPIVKPKGKGVSWGGNIIGIMCIFRVNNSAVVGLQKQASPLKKVQTPTYCTM